MPKFNKIASPPLGRPKPPIPTQRAAQGPALASAAAPSRRQRAMEMANLYRSRMR